MRPFLVHQCRVCSAQTSVPFSASVFSQIQTCDHCGTSSSGINLPPPSPPPELPSESTNMQAEELARLFSHNLTLSQHAPPPPPPPPYSPEPAPSTQLLEPPAPVQPIRYISQHYTHSWHNVPKSAPASVTSHDNVDAEMEAVLLRNSIDPSCLFPSQLNLFRNADSDQRLRLLELWRISPPGTYGGRALAKELGHVQYTSLQNEEQMAQVRYEQQMREREENHHRQQLQLANDEMTTESTAVQAVPAMYSHSPPDDRHAEPYILSGYEMLTKRDYDEQTLRDSTRYNQAIDPVYKGSSTFSGVSGKTELHDMENNYGAYAQMREYHAVNQPALHELDQDMMM